MGKSKRRRPKKTNTFDPTGLMNVNGSAEVEAKAEADINAENGVTVTDRAYDTIVSLVQKLQSACEEERECACQTLACFVAAPATVALMLRAGAVKVVAPLMLDAVPAVRHAAVGVLRNMSVEATTAMCASMVSDDVMTTLVALLRQCAPVRDAEPSAKKSSSKLDLATLNSQIHFNAVHLLWNLCESNEVAVSVFDREKLLALLLPWLRPAGGDCSLSIAVARCVHAVTDDNLAVVSQVAPPDVLPLLDALMQRDAQTTDELLLQTLAAGIAYNIVTLTSYEDDDVLCHVVAVICKALAEDASTVVHQVAELLPQVPDSKDSGCEMSEEGNGRAEAGGGEGTASPQSAELTEKLAAVASLVASQQLAAEIVTNMCCPADDDDDDDDDDDGWDDCNNSDASGEDIAMDTDMDTSEQPDGRLHVSASLHRLLESNKVVAKIIAKCKMLDDDIVLKLQSHKEGKTVLKKVLQLQSRCLLCLANLVSVLESDALGGQHLLTDMWSSLSALTTTHTVTSTPELLEAVTSGMRATSQRLAQLNSQKLCEVTPADLQLLYQLGRDCERSAVRTNAVRIVSTIGCTLARNADRRPLLAGVGEFLLAVAAGDGSLPVVAEALDAIFDVFAEDCVDAVARDLDLVPRLRALTPALKSKFQQQRRHLGDHLAIVSTAKTNLARFIAYKMQQQR